MDDLKNLAEKRYGFKLENYDAIKNPTDKMAFLRDLCLNVGITLNLKCKELILDENYYVDNMNSPDVIK
jgi:hypothetical protein